MFFFKKNVVESLIWPPRLLRRLVFLDFCTTRTSPPGAVGAVGHPFGQSRLVDRNALRALLSASAPRMHGPFGASSPPPSFSPGCPPGAATRQNRCPVTRADHFFETKSVEHKSKKIFPEQSNRFSLRFRSQKYALWGGTHL